MYYERRVNYYVNQGISTEKIYTPLYLARGYMAVVLQKIIAQNKNKERSREKNKDRGQSL